MENSLEKSNVIIKYCRLQDIEYIINSIVVDYNIHPFDITINVSDQSNMFYADDYYIVTFTFNWIKIISDDINNDDEF